MMKCRLRFRISEHPNITASIFHSIKELEIIFQFFGIVSCLFLLSERTTQIANFEPLAVKVVTEPIALQVLNNIS